MKIRNIHITCFWWESRTKGWAWYRLKINVTFEGHFIAGKDMTLYTEPEEAKPYLQDEIVFERACQALQAYTQIPPVYLNLKEWCDKERIYLWYTYTQVAHKKDLKVKI